MQHIDEFKASMADARLRICAYFGYRRHSRNMESCFGIGYEGHAFRRALRAAQNPLVFLQNSRFHGRQKYEAQGIARMAPSSSRGRLRGRSKFTIIIGGFGRHYGMCGRASAALLFMCDAAFGDGREQAACLGASSRTIWKQKENSGGRKKSLQGRIARDRAPSASYYASARLGYGSSIRETAWCGLCISHPQCRSSNALGVPDVGCETDARMFSKILIAIVRDRVPDYPDRAASRYRDSRVYSERTGSDACALPMKRFYRASGP